MKLTHLVAATLAGALVAPAAAAEDAPKAPKEKKVCRTYKVTGSLTRQTRICRTEAEWREADQATQKGVSDMQGSASGAGRCIGLNCDAVPGG
jgi:predicted secreted protein